MATTIDTYHPFDAGAGANITEGQWRAMARYWLATGVIRDQLNQFSVYADSTGMQVKVRTGYCWVQGHYGESTTEKTLSISAAHATLARKDRVVLRADFLNNRVELDVLTGTAAATPVTVALTQNTSIWEVSLAIVDVPAADTSIDAAQAVDDRTQYTSGTNSSGSLIAENLLTADTANVSFSSIPQTYRQLLLVVRGVGTTTSVQTLRARFNDDSAGNYEVQVTQAASTTTTSQRSTAQTSLEVGTLAPNNIVSTLPSINECLIPYYSSGSWRKLVTSRSSYHSASAALVTWSGAGYWSSTAAITKITVLPSSGSLAAGTHLCLYGLG